MAGGGRMLGAPRVLFALRSGRCRALARWLASSSMPCRSTARASHRCVAAPAPRSYVFCSILHCDKHPEVPLMSIKHCTEQFLASSGLNYTVFRLCGFMQVGPGDMRASVGALVVARGGASGACSGLP